MDRLAFWILLLCLAFAGCTGKQAGVTASGNSLAGAAIQLETVEQKDETGNLERFTVRKSDGAKEGLFLRLSPSGVKLEETEYTNGVVNGHRILFFASGDTQIVETYRNGIFHGPYRLFYPNRRLQLSGYYDNNAMEGIWNQYYDSGQLMEEVTFANNREDGPFREYHHNGKLKVEGAYRNGDKEHGLLKFYNEAGEHIKSMQCADGLCRTVWVRDTSENQ